MGISIEELMEVVKEAGKIAKERREKLKKRP